MIPISSIYHFSDTSTGCEYFCLLLAIHLHSNRVEFETDGSPDIRSYSYLFVVKECQRVAVLKNTEIHLLSSVQVVPLTEDATPEIAASVKRLLSLKVGSYWSRARRA